jgi:hypothetical protein
VYLDDRITAANRIRSRRQHSDFGFVRLGKCNVANADERQNRQGVAQGLSHETRDTHSSSVFVVDL